MTRAVPPTSPLKPTSKGIVERIPIPLPTISKQRELVSELEAERALVEANRKLIEIFEKKIQAKLAEVWGEDAAETGDSQ